MAFTIPNNKRVLLSKEDCLELWDVEAARFKRLFRVLSPQQLASKVKSSPCGHTYAQHIPCMVGWMEAACDYFKARLTGTPHHFRNEEAESELEFTNRLISNYSDFSAAMLWVKLETVEAELKEIIQALPVESLFADKQDKAWGYFIWSTFGHYAEHSDELEWQFSGRPGMAPDRSYAFKS